MEPRIVTADNAGLFTFDGTHSYLLGRERAALVDPGPDDPAHRARLAATLRSGGVRSLRILITHDHPDHAAGAPALAALMEEDGVDVQVLASPRAEVPGAGSLEDGDEHSTDAGRLAVLETPGHTRDHLCFHWSGGRALFAGDLVAGRGSTTWVGSYGGCVADYLGSLRTIERLELRRIFPGHGEPLEDPDDAIERFRAHRLERIGQVQRVVMDEPQLTDREIVVRVYGEDLAERLADGALWSVRAILDHLGVRSFPA